MSTSKKWFACKTPKKPCFTLKTCKAWFNSDFRVWLAISQIHPALYLTPKSLCRSFPVSIALTHTTQGYISN